MGKSIHRKFLIPFMLLILSVAAAHFYQVQGVSAETSVGVRYDTDYSGYIEREEIIAAIVDYFSGDLTRDEVLELISLYFSQSPVERPSPQEAIEALPWVEDGNPEDIARLERLAAEYPRVFWAVMDKPWIQGTEEGFTSDQAHILRLIERVAKTDDSAAVRIIKLPFLDSIETRNDSRTLWLFISLLQNDPVGANQFLANPALPDAIWPAEVALIYLESQGPEIVAAIEGLQWVHDGIVPFREANIFFAAPSKASLESGAVLYLYELYRKSPEAFLSLARKPWVQNGIRIRELTALSNILEISHRDQKIAARLVNMPFLETFEADDLLPIQILRELRRTELERLVADPMLSGGIADSQIGIVALLALRIQEPDASALVESLPWVLDGLAVSEQYAVLRLRELGLTSLKVLQVVASKSWLQDSPNSDEMFVLAILASMSLPSHTHSDEATALQIVDMPFLDIIDGADSAAMSSLWRLFYEADGEYLQKVLSHPTLRDGITDEHTVVVAALGQVIAYNPRLLEVLLDPQQITVEKRVVDLPYTGETIVSVIHVTPDATYRTMDILEQVLRRQEGFMKIPFPKTYVGLLVADATPAAGGGGPSGLLTVDPGLEENKHIIAHELAHTYWALPSVWITEGGAEFFSAISADVVFSSNDCDIADNLSELDHLELERALEGLPPVARSSRCAYTLGRALFLDLHESLGESASSAGFSRLYETMRDQAYHEECGGIEVGACYVTAAFVTDADAESAAIAEPIIRRHYYGE